MLLWRVADDEDAFAGFDEAEVAARDLFDCPRILAEPARHVAQAGILGALVRDRRRQAVVLVACPEHCEEPAIADQRIDDNYRRDEQQHEMNDAAIARRRNFRLRLRYAAPRRRLSIVGPGHARKTLQQLHAMYKYKHRCPSSCLS